MAGAYESKGVDFESKPDTGAVEVENVTYQNQNSVENLIAENPKRKWVSYIWDSLDKSPEERRLIFKLDCALLTFACLGILLSFLLRLCRVLTI
jgi:hypothetical protein